MKISSLLMSSNFERRAKKVLAAVLVINGLGAVRGLTLNYISYYHQVHWAYLRYQYGQRDLDDQQLQLEESVPTETLSPKILTHTSFKKLPIRILLSDAYRNYIDKYYKLDFDLWDLPAPGKGQVKLYLVATKENEIVDAFIAQDKVRKYVPPLNLKPYYTFWKPDGTKVYWSGEFHSNPGHHSIK